MDKDSAITPVKTFTRIHLTPSTKEFLCIIHGENIDNCNYRLRLFQTDTKTSHCLLLEKHLKVILNKDECAAHVCRTCIRRFVLVENKLNYLKDQFESTKQKLQTSHGKQAKKRIQTRSEPSSKKTLFVENGANDCSGSKSEVNYFRRSIRTHYKTCLYNFDRLTPHYFLVKYVYSSLH